MNDMPELTRRNVLRAGMALAIPPGMLTLIAGCNQSSTEETKKAESKEKPEPQAKNKANPVEGGEAMKIQYLEIVTKEVEGLCRQYSSIYDITFGEPDSKFGGARTAKLDGGGMIGIRAPMRDTETPVVRPYVLVDDIKAAVKSATEAGGKVAMPPMEIPGHGMFAIVIHGGIDCGFWQN